MPKNRVNLGRTDLNVHRIGLGANKIGKANPDTKTEYGGEIILSAYEQGVNFFDTAFLYGKGKSESIIGETVRKNKLRDQVVIATKGAQRLLGEEFVIDNRPEFLVSQVEESLRRLQTDYIDLYYIHFPDETTNKAEAVGALQRLKEAGKIRAIGVSNFSLEQLKEADQDGYVDVVQDHYNLIQLGAEETLLPYIKQEKMSFIPYFPFASGLLTGKYQSDSFIPENLASRPQFERESYLATIQKVQQLQPIADKYQVGIPHVVLAFYLAMDCVDAVIPGARNVAQVVDNEKTLKVTLDQAEIQAIATLFGSTYQIKK